MRQKLSRFIFVMTISVFLTGIVNDPHGFVNLTLIVHHHTERNHSEVPGNSFSLENHEEDLLNVCPSFESAMLHINNCKLSIWNFTGVISYSGSIFHPPRFS